MKILLRLGLGLLVLYLAAMAGVGWFILPPRLLQVPGPHRDPGAQPAIRARLLAPGDAWSVATVAGGEGRPLAVWRLHRARSRGVVVLLHGFGDDGWGPAPCLGDLPDWDGVVFTFRGRDLHPEVPATLGGWETADAVAVVRDLERQGVPRHRIVLAGASQGAGVALMALSDLERSGGPLAGALLESPFTSLEEAARNHLRGALGGWERLLRPAAWIALVRAGRIARFDPWKVSPLRAADTLATPVALLAGDADRITPIEGVRAIARHHPDLTVVPGADHLEAGSRVPGGWGGWARSHGAGWGQTSASHP